MNRYSNYPASIDSLKKLTEVNDMSIDDKKKIIRYETLLKKESLTISEKAELELLDAELLPYKLNSQDWNAVVGAITNMEEFFKNDILTDISNVINGLIEGEKIELRYLDNRVVVSSNTATVPIGIGNYNSKSDLLMVYKNGILINLGIDYKIGDDKISIVSLNGVFTSGTILYFVVAKPTINLLVEYDVSMIENEGITLNKLNKTIQDNINLISVLKSDSDDLKIFKNTKGKNGGLAELNGSGRVPDSQLGRGSINGVCPLNDSGLVPKEKIYSVGDTIRTIRTLDSNWLKCDGGVISEKDYPLLHNMSISSTDLNLKTIPSLINRYKGTKNNTGHLAVNNDYIYRTICTESDNYIRVQVSSKHDGEFEAMSAPTASYLDDVKLYSYGNVVFAWEVDCFGRFYVTNSNTFVRADANSSAFPIKIPDCYVAGDYENSYVSGALDTTSCSVIDFFITEYSAIAVVYTYEYTSYYHYIYVYDFETLGKWKRTASVTNYKMQNKAYHAVNNKNIVIVSPTDKNSSNKSVITYSVNGGKTFNEVEINGIATGVTYYKDKFVIVGLNGMYVTSDTGEVWTYSAYKPTSNNMTSINIINDLCVVTSEGLDPLYTEAYISKDLRLWEVIDGMFSDVGYTEGAYFKKDNAIVYTGSYSKYASAEATNAIIARTPIISSDTWIKAR